MAPHPVQQAYLEAQARVEVLCAAYDKLSGPLNDQVDAGEITEDAWALACTNLEDALGLTAARFAREDARTALMSWGLAQVKALWPRYGCLFPGVSLDYLEELFARRDAHRRLVTVVLKLGEWV